MLTFIPLWSPAASPSISAPRCVHVVPFHAYTRTWPRSLLVTVPSFRRAPIATIVPSADKLTLLAPSKPPLWSFVASPSIS